MRLLTVDASTGRPACCARIPTRSGWRSSPACRLTRDAGSSGPATTVTRAGCCSSPPRVLRLRLLRWACRCTRHRRRRRYRLVPGQRRVDRARAVTYGPDGLSLLSEGHGVAAGVRAGGTTVVTSRGLDQDGVVVRVYRSGQPAISLRNLAERPLLPAPPGPAARGRAGDPDGGALPVLAPAGAGPAAGSCSTRTAARTRSAWSRPAAPTSPRSGSRAGVRGGGRGRARTRGRGPAWSVPWPATWPAGPGGPGRRAARRGRPVRRPGHRPVAIRGCRSAVTWRRWRCCAA